MRRLIQAALKLKAHLSLFLFSLFALIAFTVANQLEMLSLGVITNSTVDFFSLFQKVGETKTPKEISLQQVQEKWDEIAQKPNGVITKKHAVRYLAAHDQNMLSRFLQSFRCYLGIEGSQFQALFFLFLFVASFKALTLFFSRYTTQLLSIRISRDLRQQYFEHIQKLPLSFYHKYNIGALSSRVANDASQIANSLNSCITNYIHTPFIVASSLGVCFYVSWKLSLVIFVGFPSIVIPAVMITKKVKTITRQFLRNQETFTSTLIDFLAGIQTVKAFSMEQFSLGKYKEQNDQMARLQARTAKYDLLMRPILHTITTFCLAIIIVCGLYLFNMSVAELIVFCGFLHTFYEPVKKFADENTNIQKGVIAAERLFEILDLKPQIEDISTPTILTEFKDSITFQNIWFRYEEQWVLKDLSFSIKKGESIAIIGSTGSGKSTILNLFPRLYDVEKGQVLIDGIPIQEYSQKSLREAIAIVPQKPFLFFDTIASNISYGKEFKLEEIVMAAKKAHAHEFIQKLPLGYDTHLSEMGKNLSGGQQQRLAIARALVKKAPILILDEATSALDAISEDHIKRAIKELQGEITQIIVAHRLSTIEGVDRIIFLQDGEKLAEGTREELYETCMPFRMMWDAQFRSTARFYKEPELFH